MPERSVARPLAEAVVAAPRKVAIIEGARGVGKTWMVEHQIVDRGYGFVSLLDDDTFESACRDPRGWLRSLGTRMVIDEAQRLKGLPLVIKETIDRVQASSPIYILTGSASIGRADLSGQDPLARRSMRFRLDPFTQGELAENHHNLIDDLWDASPRADYHVSITKDRLQAMMTIGGFPEFALNPAFQAKEARSLAIRSDIESILGTVQLPGQRSSALNARPLLSRLLARPGGIINYSQLARDLGIDRRTVQNDFDRLRERFLVFSLPNIALQPGKQQSAGVKVHPVDTALTVDALLAGGVDLRSSNEQFGNLFESFVVNQILPAIGWSTHSPRAFFWRDSKRSRREVDLVLASDRECIAIEVKLSTRIGSHDFDGIRDFSNYSNMHKLMRGFIVYTGDRIQQFDEDYWAIPVSSLWESSAFDRPDPLVPWYATTERKMRELTQGFPLHKDATEPSDANLFISYNHDDEKHLQGAFRRFIDAVCDRYEFETGGMLTVFIDTESIRWGDDWRSTLSQALEATNFLMPQVTPRYLRSVACRQELFEFSEHGGNTGNNRILPLIWQKIDGLHLDDASSRALEIIDGYQHIDVSSIQRLSPDSPDYQSVVEAVTTRLIEVINQNIEKDARADHRSAVTVESQQEHYHEDLTQIEGMQSDIRNPIQGAIDDMNLISGVLSDLPTPESGDLGKFVDWTKDLARKAKPHVDSLNSNVNKLESSWQKFQRLTGQVIDLSKLFGKDEDVEGLKACLSTARNSLTLPSDIRVQMNQLAQVQVFAPNLRPMIQAFSRFMEVCDHMAQDLDELTEKANEVRFQQSAE